MKNFSAIILALPACLLLSATVVAQDAERPSYNFVGLQYVYATASVDSDVAPADVTNSDWYFGEGGQLDASYALNDQFLFRGSYYTASGDYKGGRDIDFTTGVIGIGVIAPTEDAVGIDASLEYRKDKLEFDNDDEDIDGLGISFGLRTKFLETQEIGLRVGVYAGDFDQAVGLQLNYAWNFADNWALTAGYEYMDVGLDGESNQGYSLDKWLIGGRFQF
jgi:opacity protein-like surface antigen